MLISYKIPASTKIYGVSIRRRIFRDMHIGVILEYLKTDQSLLLDREVIRLLKFNYKIVNNKVQRISPQSMTIRKSIIKFNIHRKHIHDVINYLEQTAFENIEPDYVQCDTINELRYGI